ncbi:MAG: SDR family oxidoreductase [Desulfobacterales bacterium]|nr:SDR family oxidoreductase [Desulfobacterales bacterium]MCP4161687.1 SDR family oxidoreductase [Deltaproteobacteria bacterium]
MTLLKNKTALITGGSDGIGFGIAIAFAKQGANLILIGRDEKKLSQREEILKKYNVDCMSIAEDISNTNAVKKISEKIKNQNVSIDILVHNAGLARFVPFDKTDTSLFDYHLNLNVKVPYFLTQEFLNDLISSNGNVINISSYFARKMLPDRPSTAYSITKGALESFTKSLAYELGPLGVRVNAIAPGTVLTPQVEKNIELLEDSAKDRFKSMIKSIYPLQKIGEPEDIANFTVFLASDKAKWVTGGVFPVDGGLTTN